jgi:hypothetical protein
MPIKFVLSERFSINQEDVISIVKGAAIAGGGAFAVYLLEGLIKLDFGDWTALVVAVLSIGINVIRKWIAESSYAVKK